MVAPPTLPLTRQVQPSQDTAQTPYIIVKFQTVTMEEGRLNGSTSEVAADFVGLEVPIIGWCGLFNP